MTPQRTCIGCRGVDAQSQMVRLVRVEGRVIDGTAPRLPGRGAYLHRRASCVELALRRHAFRRSFGVTPEPDDPVLSFLLGEAPGWNQTAPAG